MTVPNPYWRGEHVTFLRRNKPLTNFCPLRLLVFKASLMSLLLRSTYWLTKTLRSTTVNCQSFVVRPNLIDSATLNGQINRLSYVAFAYGRMVSTFSSKSFGTSVRMVPKSVRRVIVRSISSPSRLMVILTPTVLLLPSSSVLTSSYFESFVMVTTSPALKSDETTCSGVKMRNSLSASSGLRYFMIIFRTAGECIIFRFSRDSGWGVNEQTPPPSSIYIKKFFFTCFFSPDLYFCLSIVLLYSYIVSVKKML